MGNKTAPQHALAGHVSGQCNKPLSRPAHSLPGDDVLKELEANLSRGLADGQAVERLADYGPNQLKEKQGVQPVAIFIEQIFNAMTLVSLAQIPAMKQTGVINPCCRFSFSPWQPVLVSKLGSQAASLQESLL